MRHWSMRGTLFFLLFVGLCTGGMASEGKPFSFALIGDVPYEVEPGEYSPEFERLLADINGDESIKWVLHAGDIKGGGTECTDRMLEDRKARFNRFNKPFILTPGDNEWTDCHRKSAGSFSPRERLKKLRHLFFSPAGVSLGRETKALESQGDGYPENVRWREQGVLFATIHLVGSKNGKKDFKGRSKKDDAEVKARTRAGLAWLDKVFAEAMSNDAAGVLLMIHANPGLDFIRVSRKPFRKFLSALEAHVKAFGKPVVLAHGDTHTFRVDRPSITGQGTLRNFTRVESYGSSDVHWVKITVDPKDSKVFSFEKREVEGN